MSYFWKVLERITSAVSEPQRREIMVELAYLNLHGRERPAFLTEVDMAAQKSRIVAKRPRLELLDQDRKVRGQQLRQAFRGYRIEIPGVSQEEVEATIDAGTFTFLFNDRGEFAPRQNKNRPTGQQLQTRDTTRGGSASDKLAAHLR